MSNSVSYTKYKNNYISKQSIVQRIDKVVNSKYSQPTTPISNSGCNDNESQFYLNNIDIPNPSANVSKYIYNDNNFFMNFFRLSRNSFIV